MSVIKNILYRILIRLRESSLRRPIIKVLVAIHNASYHNIAFFSSVGGVHPKHHILRYENFFLDNIKPTDTVLDLGCGTGHVAFALAQKAHSVVAIDLSAKSIQRAIETYQHPNLKFITADITTYHFNASFNVIVLSNVLEHIENRIQLLRLLRELAPTILIRVPLLTRDWLTVYKKEEGLEYRLDNTHFVEYEEETLQSEVAAAGLTVRNYYVKFGELYAVLTH